MFFCGTLEACEWLVWGDALLCDNDFFGAMKNKLTALVVFAFAFALGDDVRKSVERASSALYHCRYPDAQGRWHAYHLNSVSRFAVVSLWSGAGNCDFNVHGALHNGDVVDFAFARFVWKENAHSISIFVCPVAAKEGWFSERDVFAKSVGVRAANVDFLRVFEFCALKVCVKSENGICGSEDIGYLFREELILSFELVMREIGMFARVLESVENGEP